MPEEISLVGAIIPSLVLGKGRRINVAGGRKLADALAAFLRAARSVAHGAPAGPARGDGGGWHGAPGGFPPFVRGEAAVPVTVESEMTAARWVWPARFTPPARSREHHVEIREFQGRFLASRAIVTLAIVGICIVAYTLTVAAAMGQQPGQPWPDNDVMLAWGADFGPSTLIDGEVWRIFTSLFLHWGLIHLLLNMFCLATAGPIVERLFGHVGFAGLYLLSGLGGSITSLCYHPTVISAGASGAIFGVFGVLLGFLLIRENEIPEAKLKPMATGALGFLGYNLVFGLGAEGIDMAAHLGGLGVGLACGLLLTAITPGRAAAAGWTWPVLGGPSCCWPARRRWPSRGRGRPSSPAAGWPRIPKVGQKIVAEREAVEAWNSYMTAARPLLLEFDRIARKFDDIIAAAKADRITDEVLARTMGHLNGDCQRLGMHRRLQAGNDAIREVRRHMATAQTIQLRMLSLLEQLAEKGDQADPGGADDLVTTVEAYLKEFETIKRLSDDYFRAHSIQPVENDGRGQTYNYFYAYDTGSG